MTLKLVLHYLRLLLELLRVKRAPVPELDQVDAQDDDSAELVMLTLEPPEIVPAPPVEALAAPAEVTTPKPRAIASAVIHDGWLQGDKVVHVPSKRHSALASGDKPVILLWHWTSTGHGTAFTMAKRTQALAKGGERSGSVHFWVDGDGTIYQSVPTNRSAWHAGAESSARFKKVDGRWVIDPSRKSKLSVNGLSIGVEMVNEGQLRWRKPGATSSAAWVDAKPGDKGALLMSWPFGKIDASTGKPRKGTVFKLADAVEAPDREGRMRLYHAWTPAQIEAAERITRAVVDEYGLDRAACSWGHVDVDGERKSDPGGLWYNVVNPAIHDRVFGPRAA